ncbi:cell surface protein [Lactiplantibacillus fabifermentans T30PCM01]|uniref:Cell surface protein n=1 Tax=Lactiplantibacillus fabifermentans T30PCM01 TaxID=1400520 RepID=W6T5H1_9LACO|nr:collagen-binding domain-containing protein [Lactiplantibacillus fabifermentans]ETY73209.1 cell surface protein [Lactiplantibacillus fabifermentans T30PCM01]
MERKQTHFKMYKSGRRWAFACAVILTLGGATVTANADTATSSASSVSESSTTATTSADKISTKAAETPVVTSAKVTSSAESSTSSTSSSSSQVSSSSESNSATTSSSSSATSNSSSEAGESSSVASESSSAASSSSAISSSSSSAANSTSSSSTSSSTTSNNTANSSAKTTNAAVQDGGTVTDDYPDLHNLLGVSSQFHIFAREAELNAHTNGNIAVGNLSGNVNFGTNIIEELLDKDISYIQNINNIASSSFVSAGDTRVNKVIFGQNVEIDVSNPNRPMVNGTYIDHLLASEVYQDKDGNVYIDFDKEFAKLEKLSASLSEETPKATYSASDFSDMNNRVIDVSDLKPDENGNIVINLSSDVLTSGTPLTISGVSADKDGNTIIINVDTAGAENYSVTSQIKVVYEDGTDRDNQETEDFGDNHLLWNFYDSTASDKLATGTISIDRPFQGSVLAPAAEVIANQNLDGNIIADKVVVNAETHRWDLQDNTDNEKDPEYEKPVHPSIDIEMPEEPDPEYEKPVHPSIDIEMPEEPEPEYEKPVHPSIDVEMPEEPEPEYEKPVHPSIDVEMPTYEEEEADIEKDSDEIQTEIDDDVVTDATEAEMEAEFEEILDLPASGQIGYEETLLDQIDEAIAIAKTDHNQALVAKLEKLRTRVAAALAKAQGQSLPQTDESQSGATSLLGLALATSLAMGGYFSRRKRRN